MRSMKMVFSTMAVSTMLAAPALAATPMRCGETAAQHLALAQQYRDQAAASQADADEQLARAERYKNRVAAPSSPKQNNGENPWARKMDAHYQSIAAGADMRAAEAEEAAQYHTMRARELQGM